MNEIKVWRLLLSGLITLVVFVAIELIVENVIGNVFFGGVYNAWYGELILPTWTAANYVLNILIGLMNSIMLMSMPVGCQSPSRQLCSSHAL